jgi:hypothetical protein
VAVGLTLWAGAVWAQPAPVACPPDLSAESRVLAAPPGWEVGYEEVSHPLMGVTFLDGTPSDKASLKPDKQTRQSKTPLSAERRARLLDQLFLRQHQRRALPAPARLGG